MSDQDLQSFISQHKPEIDRRLQALLERVECPKNLKDSMLYSIKAGGKRVRPLLTLAAILPYRELEDNDYDLASIVEMVHTYSLIHDDLPAMDDDDYRRGKPTNHKIYGEAFAVLAGDALLTRAFELIGLLEGISSEEKVLLIQELSKASGAEGMVGGQAADLDGEGNNLSLKELEYVHHHKTGALLSYSVVAGAIAGKASLEDREKLRTFSAELGLVFQIKDDILDVEGDSKEMGKTAGSDEGKEKSTYPRLLTLEGAKEKLYFHANQAKEMLSPIPGNTDVLEGFINYITKRTK